MTDTKSTLKSLVADILSGIEKATTNTDIKSRVIRDLTQYQIELIDMKKTICDMVDLLNITKVRDNKDLIKSDYKLSMIITDLQDTIDNLQAVISKNQ